MVSTEHDLFMKIHNVSDWSQNMMTLSKIYDLIIKF